jgi:hypothetical protein
MNYMLCRNRVRNFDRWKGVFDSHADAHRAAGLKLVHLWYELNSPRNIFFLFEVEDIERARAFLASADATASERESGLIEGDYRFFSQTLGYGPLDEAENRAVADATAKAEAAMETNNRAPAESVNSSKPPEPVKSSEPEKGPAPSESVQTAEPAKSPEPQITPISEPVKTAEPAKSPMPPATMKGPERVKSVPLEPVEGWEPVESWPPAEAAAESTPTPSHHRGRWERIKY